MKKNGFTLIEVISVIALLGLLIGIAVPNIMKSSTKAKQKTLSSKVKNIEKSAVLFAQDVYNEEVGGYSIKLNKTIDENCDNINYCCEKDSYGNNVAKPNCYSTKTYDNKGKNIDITVELLADNDYIKYENYEEEKTIKNPVNENKMNDCKINIYQKYGKFYAVYDKTLNRKNCWW